MRLQNLGHASWLLESGKLRVLFDPLIGGTHSGGTFTVVPRRTLEVGSLRADFLLVSHAHPDHFDPESLAALARADADTVVVTPDPLIAEVARIVGFRTVREVPPGTRVELDGGLTLATTPSCAPEVEWGVLATDASGCAWNLVDTVFRASDEVAAARDAAVGRTRVDVVLAPVQPMREIALATAGFVGFDAAQYAHMLRCALAAEARALVPSAAGDAHAAPFDAMNPWVYPVSRERAARDVAALSPGTRVLLPAVGESLHIEGGDVGLARGDVGVTLLGDDPSRAFRPLEPASVVDVNLPGHPSDVYRARIGAFVDRELAPAVARELGARGDLGPLRLVLEIVYVDGRESFTLDRSGSVRAGGDEEYDVLDVVAASMCWEVLEGRRGWGEALLAGCLRSSVRGLSVAGGSPRPLSVAPMFLYYALSYGESARRAALSRAREAARR